MTRWTQSVKEAQHLSSIVLNAPVAGIAYVVLTNGRGFFGIIEGTRGGNNAAEVMPPTSYYHEFDFLCEDGTRITVSALDMERMTEAPAHKRADFVRAGLLPEAGS